MAKSGIFGAKTYSARLRALTSPKIKKKLSQAVYVGADSIRVEARRLIADGAIQGKNHVPSKPGDPPNWDTGHLANNILTRQDGALAAIVESHADYGAALERGTSKMAARPYMQPASENKRYELTQAIMRVYSYALISVKKEK